MKSVGENVGKPTSITILDGNTGKAFWRVVYQYLSKSE